MIFFRSIIALLLKMDFARPCVHLFIFTKLFLDQHYNSLSFVILFADSTIT